MERKERQFSRHGSTAEIASLVVSNVACSPNYLGEDLASFIRDELSSKHSASRASLCSTVSGELVGSKRASVAEATALIVSELNPTTQVDLRRQATVAGRVVVFLTAGVHFTNMPSARCTVGCGYELGPCDCILRLVGVTTSFIPGTLAKD